MQVRHYGKSGPQVVLIHGGPGAPGHMAPIARGLESHYRVIEPFQRLRGKSPLTVATHLDDLRDVLQQECGTNPVPLVGASWGAMLALCFAARWPRQASKLVLIGCGTWDPESRRKLEKTRASRMTERTQKIVAAIEIELLNSSNTIKRNSLFRRWAETMFPLDCYDQETNDLELIAIDELGSKEAWSDMMKLQAQGVYPIEFKQIRCPVAMLHGDHDPHPGPDVFKSLQLHVKRLTYRELKRCGHYPWLERHAKHEFFRLLHRELGEGTIG